MDLELAPERLGFTGIWMVLDNRREARLCPAHCPLEDVVLSRLRGLTATSGGGVALVAGLAEPAEEVRFVVDLFSRGRVGCRRSEAGLWDAGLYTDEMEAINISFEDEHGVSRHSCEIVDWSEERTLSAPARASFRLSFISTVRADFVELQCRSKCSGLKNKRLSQRLDISSTRLAIALPVTLALVPLEVLLVIVVSQALLEECGDRVGNTLQFLVAFLLGSLQASVDMSSDERHRHGVGTGGMGAAGRWL